MMGSFINYYGECNVPEEKKAELKERMQKLLTAGGMMDTEIVQILERKILLLKPPVYSEVESGFGKTKEKLIVDYNYFEDDRWEPAGYDPGAGKFWSNKVGGFFAKIIHAAYVLVEFYSDTFMITHHDGEIYYKGITVGWLNYLFGENYTHERTGDLWRVYKLLPESEREQNLLKVFAGGDGMSIRMRHNQLINLHRREENDGISRRFFCLSGLSPTMSVKTVMAGFAYFCFVKTPEIERFRAFLVVLRREKRTAYLMGYKTRR